MTDLRVVSPLDFASSSLDAFAALLDEFPSPSVGLATGNTPLGLYHALGRAVLDGALTVGQVRPFAIDEYLTDRDHPCANRAYFARHWETIEDAAPVLQFDPEATDAEGECARFARELDDAGGFDVVLLGIGTNGHLAFNEPGTGPASDVRSVALAAETRLAASPCFGERVPTHGLTVGMRHILAARRVLLLVNGAAKARVLADALQGPVSAACPASYLQSHSSTTVLCDSDAASFLR